MATIATLYNRLPTLGEAEERFTERAPIFAALASLLAEYGNFWGLCLVHAHCKLAEGEIMLEKGSISQPKMALELVEYYPERWLSSGEPYEFTTRRTTAPPVGLIKAFNTITSNVGVLGLYYIDPEEIKPDKMIEHTEGRKNILMPYTDADSAHVNTQTETAWDLSRFDPVTMACNKIIICDARTTRTSEDHKGIFPYPKPYLY